MPTRDTKVYPNPINISEWRASHGIAEKRTRIDRNLWLSWQAAHSAKDYKLSDKLRKELRAQGVVVHVKTNGGYGWTPA